MRKRFLTLGLAAVMALSLTACGSDNGKKVESKKTVAKTTEKTTADESKTGEVVEKDGLKKVPVITDKKLNRKGKTGPIKYNIKAIQVSKLTATTDEMAQALDVEKDKEVGLVAMDVEIENTSDDTINFYFDQGKLTTNTKEQVEANLMLSDNIDGEYLGKVTHKGTLMFILKNGKADKVNNLKLFVDAPSDKDFNTAGDEVKIELKFK